MFCGLFLLLSVVCSTAETKSSPINLPDSLRGNWLMTDGSNDWVYGFYDNFVIADNKFWTYEELEGNDKRAKLRLKADDGTKREITVKRQKDGTIRLTAQKEKTIILSRKKSSSKGYTNPLDSDFTTIFRTDSACLQGYINGYPSSLGATTSMIYLNNVLTREDYPTVVNIQPDGRFKAKFKIHYPIFKQWSIQDDHFSNFYIEPGQTLTLYLEWENMSYNASKPSESLAMGGESRTNMNLFDAADPIPYNYREDQQKILNQPPHGYLQYQMERLQRGQEILTEYYTHNYITPKARRLLDNELKIAVGYQILHYRLSREGLVKQFSNNEFIRKPIDSTYYEFLQKMPLNDPSIVSCRNFDGFVNRFEYIPIFMNQKTIQQNMEEWYFRDSIVATYFHLPPTLLQDIVKTRNMKYHLNNFTKEEGLVYIDELCTQLKEPFLRETVVDIYNRTQREKEEGYELPFNKGGEIFRKIIEPFKGKYLFIDFWATTCGPCRAGIESMANLRKKYKDSPDLQFIYITSDRESPQKSYDDYIAKNLKGEVSFRISQNDYNYLRELFRFNGIPRYMLISREGRILNDNFSAHMLDLTTKELLQNEKN